MRFTPGEFRDITSAAFFIYIFIDAKIYFALWVALLYLIGVAIKAVPVSNTTLYKAVIATYIVIVLAGYLYKFRGVLLLNEKKYNGEQWEKMSSDKKRQRRIGIAILLLILINIAAMFLWRN